MIAVSQSQNVSGLPIRGKGITRIDESRRAAWNDYPLLRQFDASTLYAKKILMSIDLSQEDDKNLTMSE
jgi:hypothetical protein